MDNRSDKFVFVPFCLLCQAFQAQGIVKYNWSSTITPFVKLLVEKDINIIQMPCAESSFHNYKCVVREPKGLKYYNTEEFNIFCEELSNNVYQQIKNILENNYKILAILGIENSPTCTINYIYTNKGMEKRMGLFMDKLYKKLSDENINIPFIGINRKSITKSLNKLTNLIEETL